MWQKNFWPRAHFIIVRESTVCTVCRVCCIKVRAVLSVLEVSRCQQAAQRGVCVINATTDAAAHCKSIKRSRQWGRARFSFSLLFSLYISLSLSVFCTFFPLFLPLFSPSLLFYLLLLVSALLYYFPPSQFNYKTEYAPRSHS